MISKKVSTLIFDFGDVLINLDKAAPLQAFQQMGLENWHPELEKANLAFEVGKINENEFLQAFQNFLTSKSFDEIRDTWNLIIKDLPEHRIAFLEDLKKDYRLVLLSNTDKIHIKRFEQTHDKGLVNRFYALFDEVFYSYEIGFRKPNTDCYEFVLSKLGVKAETVFFIDDKKENTEAAKALGWHVWNLEVGKEEVTALLQKIEKL
jgi:glucose-1-phosphatase